MLFSSSEVADHINDTFEPAWESVRSALVVTIDFGNGQSMKRTLQGNIATYVCRADGTVCDLLPGIYTPAVYLAQLRALERLFDTIEQAPKGSAIDRLRNYHTKRAAALANRPAPPPVFQAVGLTGGGGKFGIERPIQNVIASVPAQQSRATPQPGLAQAAQFSGAPFTPGGGNSGFQFGGNAPPSGQFGSPPIPGTTSSQGGHAARPDLALDAQVNERIRRKAVHEKLASLGAVRPNDIKHWLFKEVLHVDLKDPKLGLGKTLTESYPFSEEDRAVEQQPPKKVQ